MKDRVEQHITIIPDVCGGRPTIRGMRITVADVLELLAGGMTIDEILTDYPYLNKTDIQACLEYAARAAKHEELKLHQADVA
jgi:uncharacterized protein (DUF433 family)